METESWKGDIMWKWNTEYLDNIGKVSYVMKRGKRLSDDARNPTGFFYPEPNLSPLLFLILYTVVYMSGRHVST